MRLRSLDDFLYRPLVNLNARTGRKLKRFMIRVGACVTDEMRVINMDVRINHGG